MNSPGSLQEISQRIKYESFAKLSTELSNAQSFHDVAVVLQTNLKYIFNSTAFRILVFYESEKLQFEITRQSSTVKYDDIPVLPITAEVIKSNISTLLNEEQLIANGEGIYPLFRPPHIKNLCLYPVRASQNQYLIIGAGNKEDKPPQDTDYRFLRLIGESLLSKLSQLILKEQLEQLVIKRTTQLNQANQELSTLFYRASHDFNAPLTTLLGLVQLGRIQIHQPDELEELINRSQFVIGQAQNMLKKFKVLSESERSEVNIESIIVNDFLEKQVHRFTPAASKKGIQLRFASTGDERILFSQEILSVLLENLIENAIQFHRVATDCIVSIEIHSTATQLTLQVKDNGIGIAAELQPTIFNLYTRGHESSKGNGLGLYLVKRIVEKQKGTVSVESQLNSGSIFMITLPL